MSKKSLNIQAGRELFEQLKKPAEIPVKFTYDGIEYQGFGNFPCIESKSNAKEIVSRFQIDENMEAELDAAFCEEFGEVEYKVWFRNAGTKPTKCITALYAYADKIPGEDPLLRGCLGDHDNKYAPYEYNLDRYPAYFQTHSGRATHCVFPYFDFVHGNGGTLMAIGWAGMWEACFFVPTKNMGTHVFLRTTNYLQTVLLPGEEIRTGLIVRIPYTNRNADDTTNLWREWWMKYNTPKANANGTPLKPLSAYNFAEDTGLPNSDGSISERASTWKRTLDKLIAEDIVPDFRWFDAGWYSDPAGNTVESDWYRTVGSWEVDKVKWPRKTLRESNDACHKAGMKVLTWFEPERVTDVASLVKNYGYQPEWGLGATQIANNIGNENCLNWTTNRITKMMEENGVDLFREDNNSDPTAGWGIIEDTESKRYGMPRYGLAENKAIQGHYKLWDNIIDYCAKHGKCTFVDSCASGGGRNDLESMRRGVPFTRSDADRSTIALRLSMTTSFCKWIPFHGSSTEEKKTNETLLPGKGKGSDSYVNRASFLPIHWMGGAFSQNKDLDFDRLRKNFKEWKSINHLLTQDLYVLTKWHHPLDTYGWTALAYDNPKEGESLLLAFRQEKCEIGFFVAKLPFALDGKNYQLINADTNGEITLSGKTLREIGFKIELEKPRSCAMFRIKSQAD